MGSCKCKCILTDWNSKHGMYMYEPCGIADDEDLDMWEEIVSFRCHNMSDTYSRTTSFRKVESQRINPNRKCTCVS